MNQITLGINQSIYPIYDSPYREIKIDDAFIVDIILSQVSEAQQELLRGLVPAYGGWLYKPQEEQFVLQTLLPTQSSRCPILICPDDQDFSCSVLLVEIVRQDELIHWKRLGWAKGEESSPQKLCAAVEWIVNDLNKVFDCAEYAEVVDEIQSL